MCFTGNKLFYYTPSRSWCSLIHPVFPIHPDILFFNLCNNLCAGTAVKQARVFAWLKLMKKIRWLGSSWSVTRRLMTGSEPWNSNFQVICFQTLTWTTFSTSETPTKQYFPGFELLSSLLAPPLLHNVSTKWIWGGKKKTERKTEILLCAKKFRVEIHLIKLLGNARHLSCFCVLLMNFKSFSNNFRRASLGWRVRRRKVSFVWRFAL